MYYVHNEYNTFVIFIPSLLASLERFASTIMLKVGDMFSFTEDNFQIMVQEQMLVNVSGLTFTPRLDRFAEKFQENTTQTPIQGAAIILPEDLENDIPTTDTNLTQRVSTFVILEESFFVLDTRSDLAVQLARSERTLGNVIIAASLPDFEKVASNPVLIHYTLTEVREAVLYCQ